MLSPEKPAGSPSAGQQLDAEGITSPLGLYIALCRSCQRDVLPQEAQPSWHRDVHRKAAKGMEAEPDPKAAKIRARKERKLAKALGATLGRLAPMAAKFVLDGRKLARSQAIDEDCPHCRRSQRVRAGLEAI